MRFSHGDDGCVTAQESKGRAEECRDPHLGEKVENQGAETCEEQGGGHRKSGDDRDQDRGSEHGEHVLETEGEHLAAAEGAGVIDGLLLFCHYSEVLGLSFLPVANDQRQNYHKNGLPPNKLIHRYLFITATWMTI